MTSWINRTNSRRLIYKNIESPTINKHNGIEDYFNKSTYSYHIIFYDTWPTINNAEKELLKRFQFACNKINSDFITCTNEGIINNNHPLKNIKITNIDKKYINCVISMHYSSPKNSNHLTLMTLWNPIDFHKTNIDISNTINSDGFISCYSDIVDNFFMNKCNKKVIGYINHTLSEPILDYSFGVYKCFYVGINWEKVNTLIPERKKILNLLKKLEYADLVQIYGPKKMLNVDVWEGYKSYIGEIPFDGVSTIYEINKAGICLVLSSVSHIKSEICSNRLFEGLAAGVPIIADQNPFIKRWFSDNILYINTDDEDCFEQLQNHIIYIKENKNIMLKKMENCREIFQSNFLLDKQLKTLIDSL